MCMAGDDIWHLDCDKVRAEQGIHTGQSIIHCYYEFVLRVCVYLL